MLSLRKNSQHTCSSTCKWIPLPPLNKEWTDEEVYKHFNLLEEEINLINNTNIVGYKNIVKQPTIIVENEVMEIEVKPKVKKLRIVKPKKNLVIVEEETA